MSSVRTAGPPSLRRNAAGRRVCDRHSSAAAAAADYSLTEARSTRRAVRQILHCSRGTACRVPQPFRKLCELRGSVRDSDCSAGGAARTRRCASLRQRGTRRAAASTTDTAAQRQRQQMILSQRHGAHGGQHGRFCTVGAARRAAGCNPSSKLCELRGSVRDSDCSADGAARTRRCASLRQRGTRRAAASTTGAAAQRQQIILSQRHGAHGEQYGRFAL
jgi:hypothetical protein